MNNTIEERVENTLATYRKGSIDEIELANEIKSIDDDCFNGEALSHFAKLTSVTTMYSLNTISSKEDFLRLNAHVVPLNSNLALMHLVAKVANYGEALFNRYVYEGYICGKDTKITDLVILLRAYRSGVILKTITKEDLLDVPKESTVSQDAVHE